jgi:hypothetical protein
VYFPRCSPTLYCWLRVGINKFKLD